MAELATIVRNTCRTPRRRARCADLRGAHHAQRQPTARARSDPADPAVDRNRNPNLTPSACGARTNSLGARRNFGLAACSARIIPAATVRWVAVSTSTNAPPARPLVGVDARAAAASRSRPGRCRCAPAPHRPSSPRATRPSRDRADDRCAGPAPRRCGRHAAARACAPGRAGSSSSQARSALKRPGEAGRCGSAATIRSPRETSSSRSSRSAHRLAGEGLASAAVVGLDRGDRAHQRRRAGPAPCRRPAPSRSLTRPA